MPTTASSNQNDDDARSSRPRHEAEDDAHPPPAAHTRITLELIDHQNLLNDDDRRKVVLWADAVFAQLGSRGSVRAKLVDDQRMSEAHLRFSGIGGTTDVLTFDLNDRDHSQSKILDTDLIVCVDEARRQASEHGHSPVHEVLLYILHGVLHCLGHDDHTQADFDAMHQREDQLLRDAGIGPLFFGASDATANTEPGTHP